MATQAIDREAIMDGAETAIKPKREAYMVWRTLIYMNNKLKDDNGNPELIKAYDALIWLLSRMKPEDVVDFTF